MPSQPQQPISDRRLVLLKTAQSLSEGKEKPAARHRLIYRISGGPPGKRFEQKLEIDGSGDVTLETKDGLSDERVRRAHQALIGDDLVEVDGAGQHRGSPLGADDRRNRTSVSVKSVYSKPPPGDGGGIAMPESELRSKDFVVMDAAR